MCSGEASTPEQPVVGGRPQSEEARPDTNGFAETSRISSPYTSPSGVDSTVDRRPASHRQVTNPQARPKAARGPQAGPFGATAVFAHSQPSVTPWITQGADTIMNGRVASETSQRRDRPVSAADRVLGRKTFEPPSVPADPPAPAAVEPPRAAVEPPRAAEREMPRAEASSAVEERARELAQAAIDEYFADRIDEEELQRRKRAARDQALAEQGSLVQYEEAAAEYAAASEARIAAEDSYRMALAVEAQALDRLEKAQQGLEGL